MTRHPLLHTGPRANLWAHTAAACLLTLEASPKCFGNASSTESLSTAQNLWFVTTRWSLILRAGDDSAESHQALEQLCLLYWQQLFTFSGFTGHFRKEAEDLTLGFFVHLLERKSPQTISRIGGKFRSFMPVAFKNCTANQSAKQRAQKRGGGLPHLNLAESECAALIDESLRDGLTPDRLFDRGWALVLIDRVSGRLRADYGQITGRLRADYGQITGRLRADYGQIMRPSTG